MINLSKKEITVICFIVLILIFFMGSKLINSNSSNLILETSTEKTMEDKISKIAVEDGEGPDTKSIHNEEDSKNDDKIIVVDVCGAVLKPGIVKLKEGSRVIDAINSAGGLLDTVDRKKVNLARTIKDGEQIYIPEIGENFDNTEFFSVSDQSTGNNNIININRASQAELETLNGIGEVLAKRIIEYREENGRFTNIESIMNVSGIGNKRFEDIKDKITTE